MIAIYGAADDLVEVRGDVGDEEFTASSDDDWSADLIGPDGAQMHVFAAYLPSGCWVVGACPADEDTPMAPWPVTTRGANGDGEPSYSGILVIDAPEGTRLANVMPAPAGAR